jgi:hypothetical protein
MLLELSQERDDLSLHRIFAMFDIGCPCIDAIGCYSFLPALFSYCGGFPLFEFVGKFLGCHVSSVQEAIV